jgi:CheY-like chemotaxis protein
VEILSNRDSGAPPGGGRAARILVADDNSNIQRMVTLALKEHGIEVVAVGNGEAAVRSMAQVNPDLILADVFMPVRSGYEVCEYVKNDSRYAHIPVVLLLGAFDPLDENEAKRVGADGVLKKPFVPPEPMIALVKALLEKSAPERLVPVAVGAGPEPHAAPEQPAFRAARTVVESVAPDEGAPEIDYPPLGRDAFETDAPVAVASPEMHGSAQTEVEDAEVLTNRRDAALGEPAFWRPAEPEEATEDAPQQEEGGAADHDFAPVEPHPGYFDAPVVEEVAFSAQVAEPEPVAQPEPAARVENESHEETPAVNWDWAETAAGSDAPAPEQSKPEPIAGPNDWLSSATPAVVSDAATSDVHEADGGTDWPPGPRAPMVELNSPGGSAFAPSSAVWSEPETAPTPVEPAAADSASAEVWPEVLPDAGPAPKLADTQRISAETLEAATHAQEESFASESPAPAPVDAATPDSASASGEAAGAKLTTDELVNAVVARVIEKLQPQIADMINEEVLRPVVSALVRRELETQ